MLIKFNNIEEKIITLRNEKVIIDSDVAELYGVENKTIKQPVRKNQKLFPSDFRFELAASIRFNGFRSGRSKTPSKFKFSGITPGIAAIRFCLMSIIYVLFLSVFDVAAY